MSDISVMPPDHAARMVAARAYCQWHLGHRDWADIIIGAYMDPAATHEGLRARKAEFGVEHETPASTRKEQP